MKPFPLERIQDTRILVVGDLMLDRYWFGEVDRVSPEAPVPVVRVVRREDRLGGAANVARNICALGAKASLIGIVGQDEAGEQIQYLADEAGINTQLITDHTINTTLKMRVLGRQQQLLRIDFEYPPSALALNHLDEKLSGVIKEHDVVVLSDYNKGALTRVQAIINMAKQHGIPVLVDRKGTDYSRYSGASLLTPNRSEMQQAVGSWADKAELEHKSEQLRQELTLDALLITRSEQGMTLFDAAGRHHVDAQAQEVYDVSGAGDTVLATLASSRAAGLSWEEAMLWANKAGGIVVGKLGTSIVTAEELL